MENVADRSDLRSGAMPPGPRAPSIVQLARYMRRPLEYFEDCARTYGEIFTLNLGLSGNWVFLSNPEHVKQLYQASAEQLNAGEAKASIFGSIVGNTSSLVLDGEPHLRRRRLLLPAFQGDRMLAHTEAIREVTLANVRNWKRDRVLPLHPLIQQIALQAVLEGIFGKGVLERPVAQAMTRMTEEAVGSPLLMLKFLQRDLGRFSPWGRLLRVVRLADTFVYEEISRRKEAPEPGADDILSLLLATKDDQGQPLSKKEIRDELVTMVVAGHEITGVSLLWALASILKDEAVYQGVMRELSTVLNGEDLRREHVPQLKYLDACIKESMRLHSTVANGSARKLNRPWSIGSYDLPAGTMLTVCVHLLHRRKESYPNPDIFRPERFLERTMTPYEFTPFGGGLRRCLGMYFALHEMKVVLATLFSSVRITLDDLQVRAARRGAFLAPEHGLRAKVNALEELKS